LRSTYLAVGVLTLILLVAVPVGGAPALKVGSSASYNLSVSIMFSPSFCETSPSSGYCPMIAMIPPTLGVNGTLGWTVTGLTNAIAVLNVTQEVTTSSWDSLTAPSFRSVYSLNESIDLPARIASILPFLMPEIDQALQMGQNGMGTTVYSGIDWNASARIITMDLIQRHPIYTMWWVNGPLRLNETVPVLVFPANVTGSTNVDLGGLGTRAAWTLIYNLTLPSPSPQQEVSGTSSPAGNDIQAALSFNYDQQSDLLLGASADIHIGYGLSIQASLTLANTNLNLDQRLVPTHPSQASAPASGSGSGLGTGGGSGSGTGSGSDTGTAGNGEGSDSGSGSGPGSGPNPSSISQSTSPKPSSAMAPWIYWIVGIAAIAIIATSLWFARRRRNRSSPAARPSI